MPTTPTRNSHHMANTNQPPTAPQLRYLRVLAQRTGTTFTNPRTREQASGEIQRLKAIRANGLTFAELQAEQAGPEASQHVSLDYAPTVHHDEETIGYGASATWSQRA